jgi:hypothetical protein
LYLSRGLERDFVRSPFRFELLNPEQLRGLLPSWLGRVLWRSGLLLHVYAMLGYQSERANSGWRRGVTCVIRVFVSFDGPHIPWVRQALLAFETCQCCGLCLIVLVPGTQLPEWKGGESLTGSACGSGPWRVTGKTNEYNNCKGAQIFPKTPKKSQMERGWIGMECNVCVRTYGVPPDFIKLDSSQLSIDRPTDQFDSTMEVCLHPKPHHKHTDIYVIYLSIFPNHGT